MKNRILSKDKGCLFFRLPKIYQLPEYYMMFARKILFLPNLGGGQVPTLYPRLLRLWVCKFSRVSRSFASKTRSWKAVAGGGDSDKCVTRLVGETTSLPASRPFGELACYPNTYRNAFSQPDDMLVQRILRTMSDRNGLM